MDSPTVVDGRRPGGWRRAGSAFGRGLVVGFLATVAAVGVGYAISAGGRSGGTCAECDTNVGTGLVGALTGILVLLVAGPLLARLLRLPHPGLFAIPVGLDLLVVAVVPQVAENRLALSVLVLAPYGVIAAWASHEPAQRPPSSG